MTYIITSPCIDIMDKSCVEQCPVDCIYEGARMLYIHPEECIDCGACEVACPTEAAVHLGDVSEENAAFEQANASFFAGLGTPRGARKTGPFDRDEPIVEQVAGPRP